MRSASVDESLLSTSRATPRATFWTTPLGAASPKRISQDEDEEEDDDEKD